MRSYTAGHIKIHPLVVLLPILGAALGGCGQVTVPIGSNNVDTPTLLTGSIPSSADIAYSDISSEDRVVIAEKLDVANPELASGKPAEALTLPWLNPISGNSGTLSGIDSASLSETGCLSFQTTANTIAGIKLYSGTACRDITQKFAVTTLSVAEV